MTTSPNVEPPVRRVQLALPSGVPAFGAGLALLTLSGLLATLAAWGWGQEAGTQARVLLATIGLVGGILAMLLGSELLRNGNTGLHPSRAIEETGACQLIQLAKNRWELRVESSRTDLRFSIDEAHAAEISRLFDPGEVLRLSWIDLPSALGGRTLLRVEDVSVPSGVLEFPDRALDGVLTRSGKVEQGLPDTHSDDTDHRRAA